MRILRILRSRWAWLTVAAVVAAVVVGVFVRYSEHTVTLSVTHVTSTGEARLLVGAGCGTPSATDVSESATTVRVRVRDKVQRWGSNTPKCLTTTCVRLAHPLGSRTVIDDATGQPVPVERAAPGSGPSRCVTPGVLST
jgi:hypothetical protein